MQRTAQGVQRFTPLVLRDLAAAISEPTASITLQVSDGHSERVIYFAGGGMRLLSAGERRGPDVASYLLEIGRLDVETLHSVIEQVRTSEWSLRQVLERRNLLSGSEHDRLSRKLMCDEVFDLIFWSDAFAKIYTESPPQEIFGNDKSSLSGTVDSVQLSDDLLKWIDAWPRYRSVLHSDCALIVLTSRGRKALRGEKFAGRSTLRACKGRQDLTLRVLRRTAEQPLPELCARLHGFACEKWIAVVPPAEKKSEDLQEVIAELEEALPRAIGQELVREKLAWLYSRAKLADKASEQLSRLGDEALARGDREGACERWRKVLVAEPGNTPTFEKLVKVSAEEGKLDEVVSFAVAHARALDRAGSEDPREEVTAVLLRLPQGRLIADEFDAAWLAAKGRSQEAVEAYKSLACRYEKKGGELERILRLLRAGLACDPGNRDLTAWVARLEDLLKPAAPLVPPLAAAARPPAEARLTLGPVLVFALVVLALAAFVYLAPELGVRAPWLGMAGAHPESEEESPEVGWAAGEDDFTDGDGSTDGEEWREHLEALDGPAETVTVGGVEVPLRGRRGIDPRAAAAILAEGLAALGESGPEAGDAGDAAAAAAAADLLSTLEGSPAAHGAEPSRSASPPRAPRRPRAAAGSAAAAPQAAAPRTAARAARPFDPSVLPPSSTLAEPAVAELRAPAGSWVCLHAEAHELTVRPVTDRLLAAFARGCDLKLVDIETEEVLLHVRGKEGASWALDRSARLISCWRAGEPLELHNRFSARAETCRWKLPRDVEAVAASERWVALRRRDLTEVRDLDGAAIVARSLPPWTEGVFAGEFLLLTSPGDAGTKGRGVLLLEAATLDLLWSSAR